MIKLKKNAENQKKNGDGNYETLVSMFLRAVCTKNEFKNWSAL